MRILSVSDYKKEGNIQSNFRAKIFVDGAVSDISSRMLARWTSKAESIGTDSDAIILYFCKREVKKLSKLFLGLIPVETTRKSRTVFGMANINDKAIDENLGYIMKKSRFNEEKYLSDRVDQYLNKLEDIAQE